ncbi:hypothetical protein WH297_10620 [Ochrobactrum vermis]|uniref:Uncharacterized protein n=1 Tax=Ochrobactrum vermis TaxID=1827297 RepID=A0ABU8PD64_9HYPH|nr:hypothetical protein [Ochrobactrum vermis]PQZ30552.1 hypothetical protein CQZ93_10795 [Ochrobactrum vermis]
MAGDNKGALGWMGRGCRCGPCDSGGAYLKGRADNATSVTVDRLKAANKARIIEDETSKLGGGDVGAALSRWMRDGR